MSVSIAIRRTIFSDFEAMQDIAPDQRSEIVQLGPGKMTGTLTHLSLPSNFGITTGSFSRGLRTRGVLSQQRWTAGVVLENKGPISVLQQSVNAGDLVMIAPGQERYASYQGAASFLLTFIEPQQLQAFLATEPSAQDIWQQPFMVVASDPATTAANIEQLTTISAALIEHGQTLSDDAVDFYKRGILELLTAPLGDAAVLRYGRQLAAAMLVREIDHYLTAAGNRPVHISELCEQFNVNRRALHRAFLDVLGMPPVTFARRKRLGDVHTVLLHGGHETVIRAVARAHGFADLSRFAAAYRRMFGELPSQTLRRSLPSFLCTVGYLVGLIRMVRRC
jgi:AraC-like DNA-binding protein